MQDTIAKKTFLKGGEFLIKEASVDNIFIPEEANEEQNMIREMVKDFIENEIYPNLEKIEKQEDHITEKIFTKIAELGLMGAHMPETYGGMQLDTNSTTILTEELGAAGPFNVSFAAHTGIGMLPILYYGTEEQKQRYLPPMISGELIGAYCLTEPGSGSDALAAKTRADLSDDGKYYMLNGQKMWITNAGFAGLFIVFAQIDGDKFTGFIIERDTEGLTFGEEENKMGIKGSSTRQVFLENVKVPVENVLGEIGKGHHIAFNVLNVGRYKLGLLCMGGCKTNMTWAVQYANERVQFKQPISNFGAIQYKLAEQAIKVFATESALYYISNMMQEKKAELMEKGVIFGEAVRQAAEEYAIECAIIKVAGSETLDYVVDETVQIHGGMGYSEEGLIAQAYRDARINRIFEGTNEINRLLTVDMLLKRAMKGKLDIVGPAWAVQKELASMPGFEKVEGPYGEEKKAIKNFKKIILMVAGGAAKMQMDGLLDLKNEQEILMNVADLLIDLFLAESLLLRVEKLSHMEKKNDQELYEAMLKVFIFDATTRMHKNAGDAIASFTEGDLLRTFMLGLKRFTKYPPVNVKKERRKIAAALIEKNAYCF